MVDSESSLRGSERSVGSRWRDRVRGRGALIAFVALELVSFPLLLLLGNGAWFTADDWDFLSARTAGNVGDLFRGHFQHWTTLPILAYRFMWQLEGMHSYVPYQVLVVLLHLVAVALLWVIMCRAGVRPWVATLMAPLLVFFGAGAENILVAFQIAFVGAFVFGLTQLLLADHDGSLDRRDWLGLLAGFAGLMFSGVAITMTIVVGLSVMLRRGRRGWPIALFHTAPLALAYLVWSQLAEKGQSAGEYRSQSVLQVVKFVFIGIGSTFRGLSRAPVLGVALGLLLVAGLVLAYLTYGQRPLRRRAAPLIALLVGAVLFLVMTGFVRSGQPGLVRYARGTGPARARESRYVYLIGAMVLPSLALAVDTIIRRWRRLTIPVFLLAFVGLPGNIYHLLTYEPYYATLSFERAAILSLPHSPLAPQLRHSRLGVPFNRLIAEGLTLGWIVRSGSDLPSPGPFDEKEIRSQTLRFFLVQSTPGPNLRCHPLRSEEVRVLQTGKAITIERANVLVAWQPVGRERSRRSRLEPETYRAVAGPLRLLLVPESPGVVLCT